MRCITRAAKCSRSVRWALYAAEELESRLLLTAIASGQRITGSIPAGITASYTFTANAGDIAIVAVGDVGGTAFQPFVQIFRPDNVELDEAAGDQGTNLRDSLTQNGTYTIKVSDFEGTHAGNFALSLFHAPATQSTDADSGPITSGQRRTGTIDLGDIDIYTVTANVGDNIAVALGNTAVGGDSNLRIEAYKPNGALLLSTNFAEPGNNAFLFPNSALTLAGTYYIVVWDDEGANTASYAISLARAPATQVVDADSGPIASGPRLLGTLDPGDLDVYTFTANVGDSFTINAGPTANDMVGMAVYSPNGTRLSFQAPNAINYSLYTARNLSLAGTYYVVLFSDFNINYAVSMVRVPGAQITDADSGPITSQKRLIGKLDNGDIDVYTISANVGDTFIIDAAFTRDSINTGITVDLYNPSGSFLGTSGSGVLAVQSSTVAGTYYAVVYIPGSLVPTGAYAISLSQVPATQQADTLDGDGGAISSGQSRSGSITPGDQDVYTFSLSAGGSATATVTDLLNNSFGPLVYLLAPNGAFISGFTNSTTSTVSISNATQAGTYSVVVADASNSQWGNYSLGLNVAAPGPDTRSPTVQAARFDYNLPQQQVALTMNENLGTSVGVDDFTLLDGATPITSDNFAVSFNANANEIVLTFPLYPNHTLPDGDYHLTLNAGSVSDTAGNPFGSAFHFDFFSLNGDVNHDRHVNALDFTVLAQNFSRNGTTLSDGDFNGDGKVNALDLNYLASKFGTVLASPILDAPTTAQTASEQAASSAPIVRDLFGSTEIKPDPDGTALL